MLALSARRATEDGRVDRACAVARYYSVELLVVWSDIGFTFGGITGILGTFSFIF
jgi:hypothetical protein